jgi:ArsR family transcriptional regulator, arsenate/arsenite/antimonite-responsive transcriptional repressor
MLNPKELERLNRKVDTKKNERLAIIFNALSDPNRCKVFRVFVSQGKDGLCVTDVANLLKISPSAASQHLKILVITGLLTRKRFGQKVNYYASADDQLVKAITEAVLQD